MTNCMQGSKLISEQRKINIEGVTDEKLLENERLFDIFSALCVCGP